MKRRDFIKKSALASASFTIVPSFVLGGKHIPPSDTLYMAGIGVGGRGGQVCSDLFNSKQVKYVALCDVDDNMAANSYKAHKRAKRYRDFRKLFDKHIRQIDAFFVATPDHTHASIAYPFMKEKKHAYVEKPLTHTIAEARLLATLAKENNLVTQMGNQGASGNGIRRAQELLDSGVLGTVHKVDCWTNRPVWPQGVKEISNTGQEVPKELDWDVWLGPAEFREYNSAYLPFKWRGFWDFGTGALGDMGCHIMETPYKLLGLGSPKTAEASCTTVWVDDFVEANYSNLCPPSSVVHLTFVDEGNNEIQLSWYDGGMMPKLPSILPDGEKPGDSGGGSIFYGENGIMITDTYSGNPRLFLNNKKEIKFIDETYPRIKTSHQTNFVQACIHGGTTTSPFSYAGPLTETVLMGNLAIRSSQMKVLKDGKKVGDWDPYQYPGRRTLQWDGSAMKVTNFEEANQWVKGSYRKGWELPV